MTPHLPRLSSISIDAQKSYYLQDGLGSSRWCTDAFWEKLRAFEFKGSKPKDWDDLVNALQAFKSSGGELQLEVLTFDEHFFGGENDLRAVVESFGCQTLRELTFPCQYRGDSMSEHFLLVRQHFPNVKKWSVRSAYAPDRRKVSTLSVARSGSTLLIHNLVSFPSFH